MQRQRVFIGAAAVLAAATACGTTQGSSPASSAPASGTTTGAPAAPVTVTTTAPTATASTPSASTPSAASATPTSPARCTTADLTVALSGGDAGLSNMGRDIVLTNDATAACTVAGYPGVGLADSTGHLVALDVGRGGTYFAQDPPLRTITLQRGGSAVAALGWNDAGGPGCTGVVSLQIIPPDETTHLTVAFGTGGKAVGVCDPHVTRLTAGTRLTQ